MDKIALTGVKVSKTCVFTGDEKTEELALKVNAFHTLLSEFTFDNGCLFQICILSLGVMNDKK